MRRRIAFVLGALALAGGSAGCKKPAASGSPPAAASGSSALPSARPVASGPVASGPVASGSSDEVWVEARTGDPLELARLADRLGPDALAEVAENAQANDEDRAAAIRAIAYLDDPTPALDALAKLVADPSVERSTLALQTLAAVAPRRAPIEEIDPGAWRTCGDALLAALKTTQSPVKRELAIRALLGLADRGAVAKSAIPAR